MSLRILALASIAATWLAAPLGAQTTTNAHVGSAGIAGEGWPDRPVLSRDGRWVAFHSDAQNLVAGDTGSADVFVHDRASGATTIVSTASDGTFGNDMSLDPWLSADARYVVFYSFATNLVAGDVNGTCDVFLKDRATGATSLVSRAFDGGAADGCSSAPVISGDGRYVAFESWAKNLVSSPTAWVQQIFRRDLVAQTTVMVSIGWTGGAASYACYDTSISDDGRYVAFASEAPDLVAGDTNDAFDVFVWDGVTGVLVIASQSSGGVQGSLGYWPQLTADGRAVAFECATSLDPFDVNNTWDVYVRELDTQTTHLVSRASSGALGDAPSLEPTISPDGRWVGFRSRATNFELGNADRSADAYVHDRVTGETRLFSTATTGELANDDCAYVMVSGDGQAVAYVSAATNLVAGDVNAVPDVFVSDASLHAPVASYGTAKTNSLACIPVIGSAGAPRASGADAFFATAIRVLNQKNGVFFWGRASASTPFGGGTLWVAPPLVRTPVLDSGGSSSGSDCTGTYSFHFSQAHMAAKNVLPGDTLYAQFWSRDPGFAPPQNVGLTDALTFTVAP